MEGSIIAKAGSNENIHSQAAVLANICNEYIDFGHEVFKNNSFECIFISMDKGHLVAKPVYNLILSIICTNEVNIGLIKTKVSSLYVLNVFRLKYWLKDWRSR